MKIIRTFCHTGIWPYQAGILISIFLLGSSAYGADSQGQEAVSTASSDLCGSLMQAISDVDETLELPIHLDKGVLSDPQKVHELQGKNVLLHLSGIQVKHLAICLARLAKLDISVEKGLFILKLPSPGKEDKDLDQQRLRTVGLQDRDILRVRKEQTDLLEKTLPDQPVRLKAAGKTLGRFFTFLEAELFLQSKRTGHRLSFCFSPELVEKGIMKKKLITDVEGKTLESLLKGALSQLNCTYRNEIGYLYIEEKRDGGYNGVSTVAEPKTDTTHVVEKEKDKVAPATKDPQRVGGVNAVKAELGKFLLIKRIDGTRVALKFTEHTRPSKKPKLFGKLGCKYICYVFKKGEKEPTKYEGEVYEPDGSGMADHIFIYCDTFRIMWSLGDWVYFSEAMASMAKSDKGKISEVNFDDDSLQWIPYVPQWKKKMLDSHNDAQ